MKTKGKRRNGSKWQGSTCLVDGKPYGIKLVLSEIRADGTKVYAVRHIEMKENSDTFT